MMFDLFNKARKEGMVAIEPDVEEPDKSPCSPNIRPS